MSKYTERPGYKKWLERKRKRLNALRLKWTRNGLCNRCGHKPRYGKRECPNCRRADNTRRRERRLEALKKGLCTKCNKRTARKNSFRCERCITSDRKRYPKRYAGTKRWIKSLRNEVVRAYGGKCVC